MNIRMLWLMFALLVAIAVFVPVIRAADVTVAMCNADGDCHIRAEMLDQIINAAVYWHGQAMTCKGA